MSATPQCWPTAAGTVAWWPGHGRGCLSRACCGRAETFPVEWKVQAEPLLSSNCPVPVRGGAEPLHRVPQHRMSPAAVPDPPQWLVKLPCSRKT